MPAMPDDVRAVLDTVADRCSVSTDDARLVHQHSNTAVALPAAGLLVRIADNPQALERTKQSVMVTRWLTSRSYPCVESADVEPFLVNGRTVSVWLLLDVLDGPPGTGAELGRLLRDLHHQPAPPFELRRLTDPLKSVAYAAEHHPEGMSDRDRSWLLTRINELRTAWAALSTALPPGLVHGDAHSNNLIRLHSGEVVLGDWDHAAYGPREWDLVQPHYMQRRFGRHTERELDEFFTTAYGWDIRSWPGFETLIQIRELNGLSPYIRKAPSQVWARREVAHRLTTLRADDSTTGWNGPPRASDEHYVRDEQ